MDNSKKYSIRRIIPLHANQDFTNQLLAMTRRDFGNHIYDVLYGLPQPVVVNLEEKFLGYEESFSDKEIFPRAMEFSIHMKCLPVAHERVVISYPEYIPRKASFLEKLKWLFSK